MLDNAFRKPVSVDFAPEGRLCEWCGKPAVHQLTAISGSCRDEGGFFCQACGEEFVRTVADSLCRVITADTNAGSPV